VQRQAGTEIPLLYSQPSPDAAGCRRHADFAPCCAADIVLRSSLPHCQLIIQSFISACCHAGATSYWLSICHYYAFYIIIISAGAAAAARPPRVIFILLICRLLINSAYVFDAAMTTT